MTLFTQNYFRLGCNCRLSLKPIRNILACLFLFLCLNQLYLLNNSLTGHYLGTRGPVEMAMVLMADREAYDAPKLT